MSLRYVSLAATFGSLLPWMTKGVPFEIRVLWAPAGAVEADPAELQRHELALAALHLSERLLRQFFDDAPISLVVLDPAGRLLHFNPAFGAMLGYPPEDLVERKIEELVHPEDVPPIQERRRRLLEGSCNAFELETRFATASRREVWTRMSGRLERAMGDHPPHIFSHIVELTELKRLQQNLTHEAEENRLKSCDPERYM